MSKIVIVAATQAKGWALEEPADPTFIDVPSSNPFYLYVETAAAHEIISRYEDGTFRPVNDATRGQIAKIEYLAVVNP